MSKDSLTITDERNGKTYESPSTSAPSGPWTCGRSRPSPTISA